MKIEVEEMQIPTWCKSDCKFRDKDAKYMPACTYGGTLIISRKGVCEVYRKEVSK